MPAVLLVLLRAAGWAKRVAPTVDRGHSCRRPPPPPPSPRCAQGHPRGCRPGAGADRKHEPTAEGRGGCTCGYGRTPRRGARPAAGATLPGGPRQRRQRARAHVQHQLTSRRVDVCVAGRLAGRRLAGWLLPTCVVCVADGLSPSVQPAADACTALAAAPRRLRQQHCPPAPPLAHAFLCHACCHARVWRRVTWRG